MKQFLTILSIILSMQFAFGQNNVNAQLGKVKSFYLENCTATGQKTFFYNKAEKILEIHGYQVPLMDVRFTYLYHYDSNPRFVNLVLADCKGSYNCCLVNGKPASGMGLPFRSKEHCYRFINLIADLRALY